jgi:PhnB protein
MKTNVQPIPEGYHTVTPYLVIKGASQAIEFYKKAFNAVERFRMPSPEGTIGHAEIQIGDSFVMLSDESASCEKFAPTDSARTPVSFVLYVKDVDTSFAQAVKAGAKVKQPVEDKFWGDRAGTVADDYGYEWMIMTHKEDVQPDEMKKRMDEAMSKMAVQA